MEDCQKKALEKLEINVEEFTAKFKGTFKKEENRILASNKKELEMAGIGRYPTVTINQNRLKGNLHVLMFLPRLSLSLTTSAIL